MYFSDRNEHAIPLFLDANILLLTFSYYESRVNWRLYLSMSSVLITSKLNACESISISTLNVRDGPSKQILFPELEQKYGTKDSFILKKPLKKIHLK